MTDTDSSGRVSNASEPTDHTGMRVLTLQDCLARLGSAPVGRVAFTLDGEIAVLPVNHTLDQHRICFRTPGGFNNAAPVSEAGRRESRRLALRWWVLLAVLAGTIALGWNLLRR